MRRRPDKRAVTGFTLVEMMVTMAILAILFGMLILPLTTGMSLFQQTKARSDVQSDVRAALDQMTRELGNAVSIRPIGNSGQRIDFRLPATNVSTGLLETPIRPSDTVICYYVRPRDPNNASTDPEINPNILYRVSFKPPPTATSWRTATDLDPPPNDPSGTITPFVHTAVIPDIDIAVDRMIITFDPDPLPAGTLPETVTINLTLKRFDSSGSVNTKQNPDRVPQAQLIQTVRLRSLQSLDP